jgi:transcriptional regulator with XRE-family HTH domain
MTDRSKFKALVSGVDSDTAKRSRQRIANRDMLRESQKIAIKVLRKLDRLGWTQKDLAEKMAVSPQQVSKIVSGKENLTIETQIKLQTILDIPILSSYYERGIDDGNTRNFENLAEALRGISSRSDQLSSDDNWMVLAGRFETDGNRPSGLWQLHLNEVKHDLLIKLASKLELYEVFERLTTQNPDAANESMQARQEGVKDRI